MRSLVSLSILFLSASCNTQPEEDVKSRASTFDHTFESIFEEKYLASGIFQRSQKESVETGSWMFTNLARPMVMYGEYSDGYPTGKWTVILSENAGFSSNWSVYTNSITHCSFSLPFPIKETFVDSFFFKLSTVNDSLGKISIIVAVNGAHVSETHFPRFGDSVDEGLRNKGYTFAKTTHQIANGKGKYFFSEYSMKDSTGRFVKLYDIYGQDPSKRHFIQVTLAHDGPREEWMKIVFNLIVTSLYIDGDRFFNPYTVKN